MRNTEYSSNCVEPVRAPTIRSVPDTEEEKFSRISVRMRSTPSSRKVDSAIDSTVSASVKRRFQALRHAMPNRAVIRRHAPLRVLAAPSATFRRPGVASRPIDLGQQHMAREAFGDALVMAHEDERAVVRLAGREQHVEEGLAPVFVERRGRFVGDHDLRVADQCARGGHALLLADRQLHRLPMPQAGVQSHLREQMFGLRPRGTIARGLGHAPCRKAAGQQHVVQHAEIGQQVELLEDVADMRHAQAVARGARQCGPVVAEQRDAPGIGHQHAGQQRQQRALAATARAVQEHGLAGRDVEPLDVDAGRLGARPAEAKRFCRENEIHGPDHLLQARRSAGRFSVRLNWPCGDAIWASIWRGPLKAANRPMSMNFVAAALVQLKAKVPSRSAWPSAASPSVLPEPQRGGTQRDRAELAVGGGVDLEQLVGRAQLGDGARRRSVFRRRCGVRARSRRSCRAANPSRSRRWGRR